MSDSTLEEGLMRPAGDTGNVLVAVVTYYPGPELITNLHALCSEVQSVVVIDNGSPDRAFIDEAISSTGCRLVRNDENIGIAAALSQAARLAQAGGFGWLGTFDQDSLITPGAIRSLLDLYAVHPDRNRIAVLALSHKDRATGRDYHSRIDALEDAEAWRSVRLTITSGSLVKTEVFGTVGTFDDKLFIDAVDTEFCFRCRQKGYLIVEGKQQILAHSVGSAQKYFSIWNNEIWTYNHPPQRRYYITRNNLEICRRYMNYDRFWSIYSLLYLIASSIVVLVCERQKLEKLRAIFDGLGDFALRRFGPRGSHSSGA